VAAFPAAPASRAFKKLALKADKWPVPEHPRGNLEFFMERLVRRPEARLEAVR
jgi:flagellar biosynthesis protein FlhG